MVTATVVVLATGATVVVAGTTDTVPPPHAASTKWPDNATRATRRTFLSIAAPYDTASVPMDPGGPVYGPALYPGYGPG